MAYLPAKQLRVFRNYMTVARKVASKLLDEASRDIFSGQSNRRDVMSLMGTHSVHNNVIPRGLTRR